VNATVPAAGIGEAASRWCLWLLIAAGAAIIFVPLMLTAYLSVFDETIIVFPPKAYTLHWYGQIWPQFGAAIQTSLLTALASVTISLALGVPAGIGLSRYRFRGRGALSTFLLAPVTVPGIAIGLGIFVLAVMIEERTSWPLSGSTGLLVAAHVKGASGFSRRCASTSRFSLSPSSAIKPSTRMHVAASNGPAGASRTVPSISVNRSPATRPATARARSSIALAGSTPTNRQRGSTPAR